MHRFFVSASCLQAVPIVVDGENAIHMIRVLRLHVGEQVVLCDGCSRDFVCTILEVGKHNVLCAIEKEQKNLAEPTTQITLFQGIPKSEKADWILQKSVELGVFSVVMVQTQRSVSKMGGKQEAKQERFGKIVEAAAKQAGRGTIPQVGFASSLKLAIDMASKLEASFAAYESERNLCLKEWLHTNQAKTLGVFIGPEGGFSEEEVLQLEAADIKTVSLGQRILRTETAGLMVLSNVLYEWDT